MIMVNRVEQVKRGAIDQRLQEALACAAALVERCIEETGYGEIVLKVERTKKETIRVEVRGMTSHLFYLRNE
jgi:hypothetical protein